MDRFFVPRMGLVAVLALATLLIGVVVLRPKDTHANLWNALRAGYSRTEVGVVGPEGQTAMAEAGGAQGGASMSFQGPLWLTVPRGGGIGPAADPGRLLYRTSGCAQCHGMDGQGGAVGPPLAGLEPQIIAALARMGPGGMPTFSPAVLSDRELTQIGAYLKSLTPASRPVAAALAPAPTPTPTATPAPATPTPGSAAPTPTATPPATPTPAPTSAPQGDPARGQAVYAGKCAACHGQSAGGGYGPPLVGLDPQQVGKVVRQGKGGMPASGTSLIKDQELEDLLAYIHSLASGGGGSK